MTSSYKISLYGPPIQKTRPRVVVRGGKPLLFSDQTAQQEAVRLEMHRQRQKAFEVCFVDMRFYMPMKPGGDLWSVHSSTPDVDNLVKFYLDAGNAILWQDDKGVAGIYAIKLFDRTPKTVLTISEVSMQQRSSVSDSILEVFSPSELQEVADDIRELSLSLQSLYRLDDGDGVSIRLDHTAGVISKFSDAYSERLSLISKSHKGAWKTLLKRYA